MTIIDIQAQPDERMAYRSACSIQPEPMGYRLLPSFFQKMKALMFEVS